MLGMDVFGWLLVAPGILWLRERDELLDGLLLAVCGWLLLEELLELEDELDCDCDCDFDCDWDCDGWAGGCDCVC